MIAREEVPMYLRGGTLFRNLDCSDEERFEVPLNCMKRESAVKNHNELVFLLESVRFWGLDSPPLSALSYLVSNGSTLDSEKIVSQFPEYRAFLTNAFEVGQQATDKIVFAAIKVGFGVSAVEHLHQQDGFQLTSDSYLAAAELDDLLSMRYLQEQDCAWHTNTLMRTVICGSMNCLIYMLDHDHVLPNDIITNAVVFKRVEILQYLLSKRVPSEPYAMWNAVVCGDLQIIRMLFEAGYTWPLGTTAVFAEKGWLDCLVYAREHDCPWVTSVSSAAAARGHVRIAEYLHLHGGPWDTTTLSIAAKYDQLEFLMYVHRLGFPCGPAVIKHAINYGSWRCAWYCWLHGMITLDLITTVVLWLCLVIQLITFSYWSSGAWSVTLVYGFLCTVDYFDVIIPKRIADSMLCVVVVGRVVASLYDVYNIM